MGRQGEHYGVFNIKEMECKLAHLRTENAELRAALAVIAAKRDKCVYSEDDTFRIASHVAFGQTADIADAALSPQSATPTPNPPEPPAERATGQESAGDGGAG